MEVIAERACGVDVHQGVLMCTALLGTGTRPSREVARFGTMTDDLKRLRQWLRDRRVTHVAMEGTGVYWMPLYELLEDEVEVIVGNARHIKNVPGRKTDVKDSAWLADLARHGLIRKSFIPAKPFRELRYLTRYRTSLVNARTADRNRLLKLLESMNIKLSSVVSDVFGASGMSMLRALAEGTRTPEQIARLARGRLRRKEQDLRRALVGTLGERQRVILRTQLHRLDDVEAHVAEINRQIRERITPYQKEVDLLMTIPGVDFVVASVIIAELGTDLSHFSDAGALCNWVGLCPGLNTSAGRSKGSRILPGNRYLKPMLVEAAQSVASARVGYLRERFWKAARNGRCFAAVVVAHKILIAVYHILTRNEPYKDLGADYLSKLDAQKGLRTLTRRAAQLGYQVQFLPLTPAAPVPVPPEPTAPAKSAPVARHYTLRPFIPTVDAAAAPDAPVAPVACGKAHAKLSRKPTRPSHSRTRLSTTGPARRERRRQHPSTTPKKATPKQRPAQGRTRATRRQSR